jgi:hypothetical protein
MMPGSAVLPCHQIPAIQIMFLLSEMVVCKIRLLVGQLQIITWVYA